MRILRQIRKRDLGFRFMPIMCVRAASIALIENLFTYRIYKEFFKTVMIVFGYSLEYLNVSQRFRIPHSGRFYTHTEPTSFLN